MTQAAETLAQDIGVSAACHALGMPQSTCVDPGNRGGNRHWDRRHDGRWARLRRLRCGWCSIASGYGIVRHARCMLPYWTMIGSATAIGAPCTESWRNRVKFANGGISVATRITPGRNCGPPGPTKSGVGTSPSSAEPMASFTICTRSLMCSAATGWVG